MESKFRQTKRTHTFLEHIVRDPTALEPETKKPFAVKPRTTQHEIPLDKPEPQPPRAPTEVLSGLRESWLAGEANPDEPDTDAPAKKRQKSRQKKQKTLAKYAPFSESVKTTVQEKVSS